MVGLTAIMKELGKLQSIQKACLLANFTRTGVPHLILPMWADCYDYATRAEYLGIGVWGNEKAAPYWTSDELGVAFSKVLGNGAQAVSIRAKAEALGKERQKNPGRIVAAREVAKLARLGGV